MRNEFANPFLGEIFMEDFERDGVQKALGCSSQRASEIIYQRRARQEKSLTETLQVLHNMKAELERPRAAGAHRP